MALLATVLTGCGEKQNPVQEPDGAVGDGDGSQSGDVVPVTYTGQIKALLDSSCIGCHASTLQGAARNGAPLGVNFDSYAAAHQSASRANARIQAGTMPKSGPLTAQEKALFLAWIDQGLQE
jgi:uncharacterized membrane protein